MHFTPSVHNLLLPLSFIKFKLGKEGNEHNVLIHCKLQQDCNLVVYYSSSQTLKFIHPVYPTPVQNLLRYVK
jgi:hypothetical protein